MEFWIWVSWMRTHQWLRSPVYGQRTSVDLHASVLAHWMWLVCAHSEMTCFVHASDRSKLLVTIKRKYTRFSRSQWLIMWLHVQLCLTEMCASTTHVRPTHTHTHTPLQTRTTMTARGSVSVVALFSRHSIRHFHSFRAKSISVTGIISSQILNLGYSHRDLAPPVGWACVCWKVRWRTVKAKTKQMKDAIRDNIQRIQRPYLFLIRTLYTSNGTLKLDHLHIAKGDN